MAANTPGVDVPYPFDSALTFTIPPGATAQATFELIRHITKQQAPISALRDQHGGHYRNGRRCDVLRT